jgi:catecholate siderophore receptor
MDTASINCIPLEKILTIRSRKHTLAAQPLLNQSLLAMAAIGLPLAAQAQAQEKTMAEIKVDAGAEAPYKAERASSPKLTAPLLDTPQTIAVIRKELIQEQGASSVVEALRNTPGITLQLGENGNTSAGDTFQMRGFSAQSSIFVDGIRDLGAVTREAFNIEQVEVAKGPAGADIGRGAAGGYINLVSKLPTREDAIAASLGFTQGGVKRGTADLTRSFGSSGAFRLNAMAQDGSVHGSKALDRNSKGLAPSIAWGLGTPTRVYLFSQHIRQDNVPDGGIPSVGMEGFYNAADALRTAPRVDRNNWYGIRGDREKIDADLLTAKIEHELAPQTTLTNTTRWGKSSMDRIMTGIYAVATPTALPSSWTVSRLRQSVLQENRILANTTNIASAFELGGLQHTLSAGLELLSEEQRAPSRLASSLGGAPAANLYAPNPDDALSGFHPVLSGAFSNGKTDTVGAYAFDTVKLNEQWLISGGLRAERYTTSTDSATLNTSTNALAGSHVEKSGNLASLKAGLLYKPTADGSVYLAYANAKTPPGSANLSLAAQTAANANNPALKPQKTTNVELGTKWDVIQKQLALTAALYRTTNKDEFPQLIDAVTNTWAQLGERRVQGVELGAVGQITRAWSITAGIATMSTEIKEGTTGNNAVGAATRWSPKVSATTWTAYKFSDALTVGGGVRYMGEQKRLVDPTQAAAATNMPAIPHYAVVDAMASYKVNKNVSLQLNLYNVFDKFYINTLNNSGARATLGAPRYAQLTANFLF